MARYMPATATSSDSGKIREPCTQAAQELHAVAKSHVIAAQVASVQAVTICSPFLPHLPQWDAMALTSQGSVRGDSAGTFQGG